MVNSKTYLTVYRTPQDLSTHPPDLGLHVLCKVSFERKEMAVSGAPKQTRNCPTNCLGIRLMPWWGLVPPGCVRRMCFLQNELLFHCDVFYGPYMTSGHECLEVTTCKKAQHCKFQRSCHSASSQIEFAQEYKNIITSIHRTISRTYIYIYISFFFCELVT